MNIKVSRKTFTLFLILTLNYINSQISDTVQLDSISVTAKTDLRNSIKFENMANIPIEISSFGGVLVKDHFYIIGGDISEQVDGFTKGQNTEYRPDDSGGFINFNHAIMNRYSFISYSNKVLKYNISNNNWSKSNVFLPSKVANNSCFYFKKYIYCLGGKKLSTNKKFQYTNDNINVIDLNKDTVYTSTSIPHKAVNFASVFYKNYLILIGGSTKISSNGKKKYTDKVHFAI